MTDPFKIDSPTCISFSGGRTSAYMLWRVLEAHQMSLPDEAIVCFANTGKEDEATLRFVQDCSEHWNVPITWLEYVSHPEPAQRFKVVSFETANRDGAPFEQVIRRYGKLPNPINKVCTAELKIRAVGRYLTSIGWEEWDSMIGLRADELRRAAKLKSDRKGETPIAPLVSAKVDIRQISEFWSKQSFQLELPTVNGRTLAGNCDLCYLKPSAQLLSLITEKPERAIWWVQMEELAKTLTDGVSNRFHLDRPSYASMLQFSKDQANLFDPNEEAVACFCGD